MWKHLCMSLKKEPMLNQTNLLPNDLRSKLSSRELNYLESVFDKYGGFPTLESMWELLNEQWKLYNCDPTIMDKRITNFYQHPVWVLNGLFIEQHELSLSQRVGIANWVKTEQPFRIADFGGGYGTLARLIAMRLPESIIEVIDPHPHNLATEVSRAYTNLIYKHTLDGEYNLILATDVFEHVPNPILLLSETSKHLKIGGKYFIANCFSPVIDCHLPQLFHLSFSWDIILESIGLIKESNIEYGESYIKKFDAISLDNAYKLEKLAKLVYKYVSYLPKGRTSIGRIIFKIILLLKS